MAIRLSELALAERQLRRAGLRRGRRARRDRQRSTSPAARSTPSSTSCAVDQPGGELTLDASFSNATRRLGARPAPAGAAGRRGRDAARHRGPPADRAHGSPATGPLDEVDINFALDAAGDAHRRGRGRAARPRRRPRLRRRPQRRARAAGPGAVPRLLRRRDRARASRASARPAAGVRIDELALAGRGARRSTAGSRPAPTASCAALNLDGTLGDPRGPAGGAAGAGRRRPACTRRCCTSTTATPAAGTGSSCSTGWRRAASRWRT